MRRGRSYHWIDLAATNGELDLQDLPRLLPGMTRLGVALLRSRVRRQDPQHGALSASSLAPFGLTLSDLRKLLTSGLITKLPSPFGKGQGEGGVKARGTSNRRKVNGKRVRADGSSKANSRNHQATGRPPRLTPRTLLLLTDLGFGKLTAILSKQPSPFAPASGYLGQGERLSASVQPSRLARGQGGGHSVSSSSPPSPLSPSQILPHYDNEIRELSVAGEVILRLPVQGHNLAAVLTALDLSGWKSRVAKPLNGLPDGNEPSHLADAAYSLNVRQMLIDFRADGGAIRWEWRLPEDSRHADSHNSSEEPPARSRHVRRENRSNID